MEEGYNSSPPYRRGLLVVLRINRHIVKKTFKERKSNGEFTGKYGKQKDNIEKSCNKELELFTYD